jgi:hypothetical protein
MAAHAPGLQQTAGRPRLANSGCSQGTASRLHAGAPQPRQERLEGGRDRIRIGHDLGLRLHLALVVDHADRRPLHRHVEAQEEFYRPPHALLLHHSDASSRSTGELTFTGTTRHTPITGRCNALMLRDALFAAMPPLLRPDSVLDCGKPNTWLVIIGERRNVGCPKGDAAPDAQTQRKPFAVSDGYARTRPARARATLAGLIRTSRVVPVSGYRNKQFIFSSKPSASTVRSRTSRAFTTGCIHRRRGLVV